MNMKFWWLADHHIEDVLWYIYFETTDDSWVMCPGLVLLAYYSDGPESNLHTRHETRNELPEWGQPITEAGSRVNFNKMLRVWKIPQTKQTTRSEYYFHYKIAN
jgi:hypothetical protein